VLEVYEERWMARKGSARSRRRLRGVLMLDAERRRKERGKIRGRSSNKSQEFPTYVI
jgi:hypothetical protein